VLKKRVYIEEFAIFIFKIIYLFSLMKGKPFIFLITIFLLISLLALSFLDIPSLVQNIIYFVFGLIGAYFIFNNYFMGMSDEEKKNWNINLDFYKKKKNKN